MGGATVTPPSPQPPCTPVLYPLLRTHSYVQSYGDDDYLVFDCPGQIELYNHLTVFRSFVDFLR